MLLQLAGSFFEMTPVAPFYLTGLWQVKPNRPLAAHRWGLPLIEVNRAFNGSVWPEHANLPATEFCARSGVTDCVLFCVFASPIRLYARPFVTLPAPSIWSNFDDRLRL